MEFSVKRSHEILAATPGVLRQLLGGLSDEWTATRGDKNNWQPYDVIGHLINCEITDWMPRAKIILDQGTNPVFEPFDRFAQFELSEGKTLVMLLDEFERLRIENLTELLSWNLSDEQLDLEGVHPELGKTKLRHLIATWVVHDLSHIRQIAASMARRYDAEVGPWKEYLSIL